MKKDKIRRRNVYTMFTPSPNKKASQFLGRLAIACVGPHGLEPWTP